jgi:uncharacterized membrane protein (DUF2068 family)
MSEASPQAPHKALRLVALFEAFKGLIVLAGAFGLISLLHRDIGALAEKLIEHTHLNPASHYPQILLDAASHLHDSKLIALSLGALAYSGIRLVEAYGLFRERAWAEVLAAVSGAIYLPFEVVSAATEASPMHVGLLMANAAVVAVMVYALFRRRKAPTSNAA